MSISNNDNFGTVFSIYSDLLTYITVSNLSFIMKNEIPVAAAIDGFWSELQNFSHISGVLHPRGTDSPL